MKTIRNIVKRNALQEVSVPVEFGEKVEVIVTPASESQRKISGKGPWTEIGGHSGFIRALLADRDEDVWNGI